MIKLVTSLVTYYRFISNLSYSFSSISISYISLYLSLSLKGVLGGNLKGELCQHLQGAGGLSFIP